MTDQNKSDSNVKQIISKDEFILINKKAAHEMSEDASLQKKALDIFISADKHRWIHQSKWLGEPLLNLPQDMFALQDIIWETRPDYIVEVGVAWGGSLLFEATLLELLGGQKVIGVDIFIPEDLRSRLLSHEKLAHKIELIEGSSTSPEILGKIKNIIGNSTKVLVILDSNHTHDHVLTELKMYCDLVGKGQYLICGDTIVEQVPLEEHARPRPWGPGNNPATAVNEFLTVNKRFIVDKEIDQKLLFTCHPGGYLKAID
jgi:cephalosporin hydroxylase